MSNVIENVSLSFIRYANCWEDASVLLRGLDIRPGSRLLSVGSAGDNSFSLLTTNPELLVIADVSMVQLHLIYLKIACFKALNYVETLTFLGFKPCFDRTALFIRLKSALPVASLTYWEQHQKQWQQGIIHQGKFERYFQFFSQYVLPLIHGVKVCEGLVACKDRDEQQRYYWHVWNNKRWRALFHVFFSRFVLGRFGRSPEFMNEVTMNVGAYIFKRASDHLQTIEAQSNFMLHYILFQKFDHKLPHYVQEHNFFTIKNNIEKISVVHGQVQDAIEYKAQFDYMNLSNIFEYMNSTTFEQVCAALIEGLSVKGKMAYWNLMVPRSVAQTFPEKVAHLNTLSELLSKIDNGFFYQNFNVDYKL